MERLNDRQFDEYIKELDTLHDEDKSILFSMEMIEEMKGDFRIFLHFVWKESFGFTPHPIQFRFANLMQSVESHSILMAFREFGKTIMDATLTAWDKYRDPHHTTLVVSAARPRSMEITGMALGIIKACPFLSHLTPGVDDLDGRMAFTVGNRVKIVKEASCVATSITSGNTGAHADRILSDDIEIPKNSDTQEKRQQILTGVDEYTYILNRGGVEIYIGTPQTEESVYFKLAEGGSHTLYRVPAEYPNPEDEVAMRNLAPFLLDDLREGCAVAGEPTYPQRFSQADLAKSKAKSPSTYALQMLLDPSASDEGRYPLKLRDFIVMDLSPEFGPKRVMWSTTNPRSDIPSVGLGKDMFYAPSYVDNTPTPYEHSILGLDPAGTGADEVGYCVGKRILGQVFITSAGGIQGGYDEPTLKRLCQIMIEQSVKEIRIQKTLVDSMYSVHLARVMGQMGIQIPFTPVPAFGQKEVRIIETLEPAMATHKVIIDSKVARDQELMKQITRLTKERGALIHDDRVDAMQICLSGFTESFIIDTDKMIEDKTDADFQEEIQGFLTVPNKDKKNRSFIKSSRRKGGRSGNDRYVW